jgi:hypothetical protein
VAAERNRSPTDKRFADLPVVSAAVAAAVVVGMAVSEQQEFLSVL